MKFSNPFSSVKRWLERTKPTTDASLVPNRAKFREMGLRGRRDSRIVTKHATVVAGLAESTDHQWMGRPIRGFIASRQGRSLPMVSHRQAAIAKLARRQAGWIALRKWRLAQIEARRKELT